MGIQRVLVLALALLISGHVVAGDEEATLKYKVAIAHDDGNVAFDFDSDEAGIDLHGMQEGESRSFVDKAGNPVLVTRTANGFTFDVNGKSIDVPLMGEGHEMVFVNGDETVDHEVHMVHGATAFAHGDSMPGTMIISGKPIDDATRESIRALLASAGHVDEVQFIDTPGSGEPGQKVRKVKVIRKEVETTK